MLRKSPSYDYSYALLIKNIDKQVTIGGDRYNYATEYYSGKKIMFTGDFTKMLNGDSAIMFGIYKGTDVNDIPGFDAYFLEDIQFCEIFCGIIHNDLKGDTYD